MRTVVLSSHYHGSHRTTGANWERGDIMPCMYRKPCTIQQCSISVYHNTGSKGAIKLQHLTASMSFWLQNGGSQEIQ